MLTPSRQYLMLASMRSALRIF